MSCSQSLSHGVCQKISIWTQQFFMEEFLICVLKLGQRRCSCGHLYNLRVCYNIFLNAIVVDHVCPPPFLLSSKNLRHRYGNSRSKLLMSHHTAKNQGESKLRKEKWLACLLHCITFHYCHDEHQLAQRFYHSCHTSIRFCLFLLSNELQEERRFQTSLEVHPCLAHSRHEWS